MNRKLSIKKLLFFVGTAMLCNGGCHPYVTQTINPASPPVDINAKETVVMMPMADYSSGITPDKATRRQAKIMTALSAQLAGMGLMPVVQEDVNDYLYSINVISPVQEDISQYDSEKWGGYIQGVADSIMASGSGNQAKNTVGVSPEIVKEIGSIFHAKYLLRGRIVEYQVGQDRTFNPIQRGILPFMVDGTTSALFGIAKSDQYDTWQEMATVGTAGAVLGTHANTPFTGIQGTYGGNAAFWGAVGAGTAYLANKGGDVPEARVQIELALQSTSDAQVVWLNRTEFTVTPENAYDRYDQQYLLTRAAEEATAALMEDMRRRVYGTPTE